MGSFGGHALPGSFFIIFALWWTWKAFKRYHRSKENGKRYNTTVTFPADCLPAGRLQNLQWEGIFKVFFTSVGLAGEIITAFHDGHFTSFGNGQHATMFFFFGLSGAVDILMHHGAVLPKNTDYVISILAFIVEDVLFMFHLHGRSSLDVTIHTLLVYTIHACVIVSALEMRYRNSLILTLARCFVVLLQGTWFWQAGIILYKPLSPWDAENHHEIMLVTMMFTWHMAFDFIIIMVIGLVVKMTLPLGTPNEEFKLQKVAYKKVRQHEKLPLQTQESSESEVEFLATKP